MAANRHPKSTVDNPGGLMVVVKNNDVTRAMKKFKKLCKNSDLFRELEDKRFYMKPSARKKMNRAIARKRHLKELAKRREREGF